MIATTGLLAGNISTIFTKCQVLCSVKIMTCYAKASPILYAFYLLYSSQNNTPVQANTRGDSGYVRGKTSPTRPLTAPPPPPVYDLSVLHNSAVPVLALGLQACVNSGKAQWIRTLKLDSDNLVFKHQPSP